MKIIDFEELKAAYEEDLIELLTVFKEDGDQDYEELVAAIEGQDIERIKQYAHKIKGSSMIILDEKLQALMADIEMNAAEPAALKPLFDKLKAHYPLISTEIGKFLQ